MKIKDVILDTILILIWGIILYMFGVLVTIDFNVANWEEIGRLFIGLIFIVGSIIIVGINLDKL